MKSDVRKVVRAIGKPTDLGKNTLSFQLIEIVVIQKI